jgi:hypothetical protein
MGAISSKLRKWIDPKTGNEGLTYWCQGCKGVHGIRTKGPESWEWNGDVDKPVFIPSVLTRGIQEPTEEEWVRIKAGDQTVERREQRCHTFVGYNGAQPGEVIFLGDCTHSMAGTVQPFPDLPDWLRNQE